MVVIFHHAVAADPAAEAVVEAIVATTAAIIRAIESVARHVTRVNTMDGAAMAEAAATTITRRPVRVDALAIRAQVGLRTRLSAPTMMLAKPHYDPHYRPIILTIEFFFSWFSVLLSGS